jgi:hypothetical protein
MMVNHEIFKYQVAKSPMYSSIYCYKKHKHVLLQNDYILKSAIYHEFEGDSVIVHSAFQTKGIQHTNKKIYLTDLKIIVLIKIEETMRNVS